MIGEVENSGGQRPFITLSEALTWLAFGEAIESKRLAIKLWADWEAAAMAPPMQSESENEWKTRKAGAKESAALEGKKVDRALIEAAENLLDRASEHKVEMRGQEFRHCLDGRPDIRTERIPAARFHDYRCFDTRDDSLLRGRGLAWMRVPGGVELASPRDETNFRHVIVNRDDLEREFPLSARTTMSTGKAETDCESWLLARFAEDSEHRKSKSDFEKHALREFSNLSGRGFSRVWSKVAPTHGRSTPGAKSKR